MLIFSPLEMEIGNWVPCVLDEAYEICDQYPHNIRRKGSTRNVAINMNTGGYLHCKMNGKRYLHHRVVALQFIPNDDPATKTEVDHIDRIKTNNDKDNLRWCTRSQNIRNRNRTRNDVEFEYLDELPDDAINITNYGRHTIENHYYSRATDSFYFHDQELNHYRKLHTSVHGRSEIVQPRNVEGKQFILYIAKFKRDHIMG